MYEGRSIEGNIASVVDIAQNKALTRQGKYLATKPGAEYGSWSSLKGMCALTYTDIFRVSLSLSHPHTHTHSMYNTHTHTLYNPR